MTTSGEVVFDCVLEPFGMAFRYEGRVDVRADASEETPGAHDVWLSVPSIPGIAPVAIEGGRMESTFFGTVGGSPAQFWAETPVNVAANAEVPIAPSRARGVDLGSRGAVKLESLAWAFDEINGLATNAECEVTKGGDLGSLKAAGKSKGAKASAQVADAEAQGDGGNSAQGEVGNDNVPGGVLGVVWTLLIAGGAAIALLMVRRRRRAAD